jgi:hypothetical protein
MVEFLSYMLVEINGLNKEKDIDPWIKVSRCIKLDCKSLVLH